MIFSKPQAQAIATGRKRIHRTLTPTKRQWRPGRVVSIQAEVGGEPIAHVRVLEVHEEPLRDPNRSDAQAEGYGGVRGVLNCKRAWLDRYDTAFVRRCIDGDGLTDELVAARFAERHVGRLTVMIEWELTEAPDRFLARPVPGKQGDYTYSAARSFDELPVVPPLPADLKRAREEGAATRARFRHDLEAERAERKRARVPYLRELAQQRREDSEAA